MTKGIWHSMEKSQERLDVLNRINQFEEEGRFNDDVEIDQPAKPILPKDVDYTGEKFSSKIMTKIANTLGKAFFEHMIKSKKFIIKDISGFENVQSVPDGAIVTSNHFNIRDNYAVYRAMKPIFKKGHYLYKVIKGSNYTNFAGPVRIMMRHANTIPISANYDTMKLFYKGIGELLSRGEKILIYPEQAMWWNYRKPRPLKPGTFKIASMFNVPVLPVFITMKDSDVVDDDGFFVQEYYIHFLPPIYPDKNLSDAQNAKIMSQKNYDLWVSTYEQFYNTKLIYNKKSDV